MISIQTLSNPFELGFHKANIVRVTKMGYKPYFMASKSALEDLDYKYLGAVAEWLKAMVC